MKIEDEFTNLKVTRQRKYALRHPEKQAEYYRKWKKTEKGKASNRRYREKVDSSRSGDSKAE